jgi:L-aspartate oxidase
MKEYNYLVIGSGIAGLTYAVKMASAKPDMKVAVVTKAVLSETNTRYAQGGIAVVTDFINDSFEAHIKDTMIAGDFTNDPDIVEMVVKEAPERLYELINWGAEFDTDIFGNLNLNLEGGHTARRIIHNKDSTGFHIEKTLLKKCKKLKNITFFEKYFAVDLITHEDQCYGAEIINLKNLKNEIIYADATVIATGGAGQMYDMTTNPVISTGDGVAMAKRAGAEISNMQYVQFHPTALYDETPGPAFLISEAVRGFGAILRNDKGEDFVKKYDERGSLATRDIVARVTHFELQKSKSAHLWLDCRHLDLNKFKELFPNIYEKCREKKIDLALNMIPIAPAAHYICGGIKTDANASTGIQNLYAIGESACTGLHGANRLASNSLLEAIVFAHRAYIHSRSIKLSEKKASFISTTVIESQEIDKVIKRYRHKLQHEMMKKAGIVKAYRDLVALKEEIDILNTITATYFREFLITIQLLEFRNILTNCSLVVNQSLKQAENKGTFFNTDLVPSTVIA